MARHFVLRASLALTTIAVGVAVVPLAAAPRLRAAEARVTFASASTCDVDLTLSVFDATSVEHRLERLAGATVELIEVRGGRVDQRREIGRTDALTVSPATQGAAYGVRYRVTQSTEHANRCPLWLPTAPADGQSRPVQVFVELPAGMVASNGMPSFAWEGASGAASLPHLPAFVLVPFAPASAGRPWDVSRVMDVVAVTTLAGASLLWARRRRH